MNNRIDLACSTQFDFANNTAPDASCYVPKKHRSSYITPPSKKANSKQQVVNSPLTDDTRYAFTNEETAPNHG